MVKEDALLQEEMGRLVIESISIQGRTNENPFIFQTKKDLRIRPHIQNLSCSCISQKKNANSGISKKKPNKILKEPVLQIIKSCVNPTSLDKEEYQAECNPTFENCNVDPLNLCTLVKTCHQLKISSDSKVENEACTSGTNKKWWNSNGSISSYARDSREVVQHTQTSSCSHQALNPPCDVTIDELASYFETLVHIPKKMSSMAEMMYI